MLLTNVTRLKLSSTYPKSHLPLPQSHLPIRLYGILTPNTQPHPRSCIPYPRSYITYPRSNIPHPKSHLPISLNRTPTPGYTYPIQGYTSFTCLTNYCRLHVWVFGLDYTVERGGRMKTVKKPMPVPCSLWFVNNWMLPALACRHTFQYGRPEHTM